MLLRKKKSKTEQLGKESRGFLFNRRKKRERQKEKEKRGAGKGKIDTPFRTTGRRIRQEELVGVVGETRQGFLLSREKRGKVRKKRKKEVKRKEERNKK